MTPTSTMLIRASLAGVLLLASAAASAADTIVARCGSDGATFHLSDVSEEDASLVYNLPAAPTKDAVLVIDSKDGSARWSTTSRRNIDRDCGGDGNDEIVLFELVQPRDGLWRTRLTDHSMSGCPAMLASRLKAMLPGVTKEEGTAQRTFDKPFHPRGLMHDGEHMDWMQVGPDRWRGVVKMKKNSQAGMSMDVVAAVNVISPTRMSGTSTVTLTMPPQMAAMLGGGAGPCKSIASAEMTWSQ